MTAAPARVGVALADARSRGVARLDAELMLARLLGVPRTAVIARDDAPLEAEAAARWNDWLARRQDGEPLAYLFGEKEFFGLSLEVNRDVLVPRPETELLVEWALQRLAARPPQALPAAVVDLGTGSGAIAVAVAVAVALGVAAAGGLGLGAGGAVEVTATDIAPPALAVARRNAERLGAPVTFIESDWWRGLAGRSFDLALANPPYVADDDPALSALRHEPRGALAAGSRGLAALQAIVAGAAAHLLPAGWLLLEHGADQAEGVRAMLAAHRFAAIETRTDLAGHDRLTGGRVAS